jgi:hypothetical protein
VVGFLAALGATAALAAPVSIGPYTPALHSDVQLHMVADPVEGAWAWYPGPGGEQLRRIREGGSVAAVVLPSELRGSALTFTVFPNGWALATNSLRIVKRGKCHEYDRLASHICDSLVAAQRSPAGRWTRVQAVSIPGSEAYGQEALEASGHVQLAWEETGKRVRLAIAPLGRQFGAAHLLPPLFGRRFASEIAAPIARHGHLYVTSTIGDRLVESKISSSGRLGRLHRLRGSALGTYAPMALPEPDGSEVWVYEGGRPESEELLIAHRARGASTLGSPERVAVFTEAGFQTAQAPDGRVLLSLRTDIRAAHSRLTGKEQSRITAAVISPTGKLAPPQTAAFDPEVTDGSYTWAGAIDDRGDQLIVTTDSGGAATSLWASVASSHCPVYSPRFGLSAAAGPFAATAGRQDVFHVAWVDASHDVQVTEGRIACQPVSGIAP